MSRFVLRVLHALCVGWVLAIAPGAFAQAPGTAEAPTSTSTSTTRPAAPSPTAATPTPATEAPPPSAPSVSLAPPPSAADAAPAGLSPTYFWIAASTTIIVASLGGFEALHVRDLYDQAQGLPPVSPERETLHDKMKTAEVTADVLLVSSLVLAVGTTILAFHIDWSGRDRQPEALARRPQPSPARSWW